MNKMVILVTTSLFSAFLFGTIKANAQTTGYQVISNQSASRVAPYHNANNESHYIWNLSHTIKLHNLENFSTTTWTLERVAILSHNGKKAVYFNVTDRTGQFSGWVWHGFLKGGPYQYHEDSNADGLNLSDPANTRDFSMLGNYIYGKLSADGYLAQPDLMKLTQYYGTRHTNNLNTPFKDAIMSENMTLDPTNLVGIFEYPVSDLTKMIDPNTGDILLEDTGNGELGNTVTAQIENFLKANHTTRYGLWFNLSGSASNGTLSLDLVYMGIKN
ncbi:hypothetical protein [Lentilactobacillus hilgardii]|uniref:D-alanyl-D-alanine carboxypeptidase n=1 Tax=Lentilactobacillus hilgardii TaxID=1588 RepID=A0A6P1E9A3_LENHI|nr:hypothetical protein [Lentilactobacillus hilgardii]MCT3392238.1 hypothetical protein [Lentilactobacillus hilgardii]QHB50734.1 hypothetical protein GQR93_00140 [Lentilactobacillus hilgardii]RRG08937.1 MAG: hypothetical protein DUD35_10185 [Lactobacillus sp.]